MTTPLYKKAAAVARILAILVLAFSTQIASAGRKIKTISVSGNLNFSNVVVGSSAQLSITISNAGNTTLNVSSITLPAGFSTTFVALNIAVGKTASAVIKFSPTAAQLYSGTATVVSGASSGTHTLPVSGTGIGRTIALAGNLSFGGVDVNSNAQKILTISNPGTSNLTVSSISYPAGFSGVFSGVLAPSTFTNVTVTFSPTVATNYSGTVTVNSDKLGGTNTIAASGTGIAVGATIVLRGNLSFGVVPVNTNLQATLVISNSGNATLHITNIVYPTAFSGSFQGAIAAGKSTNVTVTFSPTAAINYSGSAAVTSDAVAGVNTIAVSGAGAGGRIALGGNLSFGNVAVNSSAQSTLVISNIGTAVMNVSGVSYPAGFSGDYSGAIGAGAHQNVTVTFSPTSATKFGGPVAVSSDALSGTNTIQTSGTGVRPRIAVSGNLSFGNVAVNTSAQLTLVISNSGTANLAVSNIVYPGGFSGAFSGTLAPGAATNVTVNFMPTDTTNYSGTVTVVSGASTGTSTAAASGAGIGAVIGLSGNLSFGGLLVNTSNQLTLTISNSGNATLNVSSISYPSGFSGAFVGAIAPGSGTNVTVTFSPTSGIPYGGTVTVHSDAFKGTGTTSASGTGLAPTRIIALGGVLNFGGIFAGSTAHLTLTISNIGNSDLTFTNITLPAQFAVSITSGVIAAGNTTNVDVAFTPPNTNTFSGDLTVDSDASSGTNKINVTGYGTNVANPIIVLGADLNFGDVMVGSQAQLSLLISNSGNATLTVNNVDCPTGFSSSFTGAIAPGTATNAAVIFSPVAAQSYGGVVTVVSDASSGANTAMASGDAFNYVAANAVLNGLFYPSNNVAFTNSGYFSAKASTKNKFSAKIRLAGKQYSLSGTMPANGSFSGHIVRKGLSNLAVTLQAGFEGGNVWKGTISDGSFMADVLANRSVFNSKTNLAPQAGTYTVAIPSSASAPLLSAGTGTVVVSTTGAAKVLITLGDGTKMTETTAVGQSGQLPFFGSLYSNKGSILGWLIFGNTVGDELNGNVDWFKPAGIDANNPNGFSFMTNLTGAKH